MGKAELEFAPLASQLEKIAHKNKGEDNEGDEVERGQGIKQQRVRSGAWGNDGP